MAATYTGSCKCGEIKIEMEGEPDFVGLCHCRNCHKTTGSTYSTNAVFQKSVFTIVSGEPKVYEVKGGSGNPVLVHFCGTCGCTMFNKWPEGSGLIVVKAGVLDGDVLEKLTPKAEVFTTRKPGWIKSVDGAAQFDEAFPMPASQ